MIWQNLCSMKLHERKNRHIKTVNQLPPRGRPAQEKAMNIPLYTSGLSIPAMARFFNQRTRQQYVQHSPKINFPALNAEGRRNLSSGSPRGLLFRAAQIPDL